jgi:hypothetical protein
MKSLDESFVDGEDCLSAVLKTVPFFEAPETLTSWLKSTAHDASQTMETVAPDAGTGEFTPPKQLRDAVIREARQLERQQAVRRHAVWSAVTRDEDITELLGTKVSEATEAWLRWQARRREQLRFEMSAFNDPTAKPVDSKLRFVASAAAVLVLIGAGILLDRYWFNPSENHQVAVAQRALKPAVAAVVPQANAATPARSTQSETKALEQALGAVASSTFNKIGAQRPAQANGGAVALAQDTSLSDAPAKTLPGTRQPYSSGVVEEDQKSQQSVAPVARVKTAQAANVSYPSQPQTESSNMPTIVFYDASRKPVQVAANGVPITPEAGAPPSDATVAERQKQVDELKARAQEATRQRELEAIRLETAEAAVRAKIEQEKAAAVAASQVEPLPAPAPVASVKVEKKAEGKTAREIAAREKKNHIQAAKERLASMKKPVEKTADRAKTKVAEEKEKVSSWLESRQPEKKAADENVRAERVKVVQAKAAVKEAAVKAEAPSVQPRKSMAQAKENVQVTASAPVSVRTSAPERQASAVKENAQIEAAKVVTAVAKISTSRPEISASRPVVAEKVSEPSQNVNVTPAPREPIVAHSMPDASSQIGATPAPTANETAAQKAPQQTASTPASGAMAASSAPASEKVSPEPPRHSLIAHSEISGAFAYPIRGTSWSQVAQSMSKKSDEATGASGAKTWRVYVSSSTSANAAYLHDSLRKSLPPGTSIEVIKEPNVPEGYARVTVAQ